jgi:hypothetical protein
MSSTQLPKSCYVQAILKVALAVAIFAMPALCTAQNHKTYSAPPVHPAPPARTAPAPHVNAPAANVNRTNPYAGAQQRPNNPYSATPQRPNTSSSMPGRPATVTNPAYNPSASPGAASFNHGGNFGRPGPPTRTVNLRSGGSAQFAANGRLHSIDRGGSHIQYGAHGGRTVVTQRNGTTVVTTGAHAGYVQRSFVTAHGNTYVQRTYVTNNVSRTVAYRTYSFHGANYYAYAPAYYYRPAFYRWAYTPWRSMVYFSWGYTPVAYPWYGAYSYYFTPYAAYPGPAYWVTDYLIAANLQAAYATAAQNQAAAAYSAQGPPAYDSQVASTQETTPLSPAVRQAIAREVQAQLQDSQAAAEASQAQPGTETVAANNVPTIFAENQREFVVDKSVDVVAGNQQCTLTAGDVIHRQSDGPDADQNVQAMVSGSKKADCALGAQITVAAQDLQEMQNHFREQIDSGLQQLAAKQGTGNIPRAPDTTQIAGEVPPPVADATAMQTLQQQEVAADQTEREATQQTGGQGAF